MILPSFEFQVAGTGRMGYRDRSRDDYGDSVEILQRVHSPQHVQGP